MTTPSELTEAYQEGFDAFYAGADQSHNPYERDCDEHLQWNDGYMKAEELEL